MFKIIRNNHITLIKMFINVEGRLNLILKALRQLPSQLAFIKYKQN